MTVYIYGNVNFNFRWNGNGMRLWVFFVQKKKECGKFVSVPLILMRDSLWSFQNILIANSRIHIFLLQSQRQWFSGQQVTTLMLLNQLEPETSAMGMPPPRLGHAPSTTASCKCESFVHKKSLEVTTPMLLHQLKPETSAMGRTPLHDCFVQMRELCA